MHRFVFASLIGLLSAVDASAQATPSPGPIPENLDDLVDGIRSNNAVRRADARGQLYELRRRAAPAVPQLVQCLQHKNPEVRLAAAGAIGAIASLPETAVPALAAALRDEDAGSEGQTSVPCRAALSLGQFGKDAQPAIPALLTQLRQSKDVKLRQSCVTALGRIGCEAKTVVPLLTELLAEKDLRGYAASALANFGTDAKDAVPTLLKAYELDDFESNDKSSFARGSILEALARTDPDAERHIPKIYSALTSHPAKGLRSHATSALLGYGPRAKQLIPLLIARMNDPQDSDSQRYARILVSIGEDSVQPLIANFASRKACVIHESMDALAALGAKAEPALPRLYQFATDKNLLNEYRGSAQEAIEKIEAALKTPPQP